jgi:hypothetical protein
VRVSKTKLQFVEEEVKYLEHLISKGKHKLDCEWFEGITGMPLSETKWEHQKFLGLMGYCRLWIESYALKTNIFILNSWKRNPTFALETGGSPDSRKP